MSTTGKLNLTGLTFHADSLTLRLFTAVAALSGAGAGALQALAGAPAENVRLLMESGSFNATTSVSGWRHAWREVFIDSTNASGVRSTEGPIRVGNSTGGIRTRLSDVREAKIFASEVREMAGRGTFVSFHPQLG